MVERKWHIQLGAAAELDFANILKWISENFGARQSRVCRNTIVKAIGELAEGAVSRALRLETRSYRVIGRSTLRGRVAVHAKS
jgi:plasmid stabilization system protein ParE